MPTLLTILSLLFPIADLSDPRYQVRESAHRQFERLGILGDPALALALSSIRDPEGRMRAETLLEQVCPDRVSLHVWVLLDTPPGTVAPEQFDRSLAAAAVSDESVGVLCHRLGRKLNRSVYPDYTNVYQPHEAYDLVTVQ